MIPKKSFEKFTEAEKASFKLKSIFFKDEGHNKTGQTVGPVYVEFAETEYDRFMKRTVSVVRNYTDGMKASGGGFYAGWFTLPQAIKLAKQLKVPLDY